MIRILSFLFAILIVSCSRQHRDDQISQNENKQDSNILETEEVNHELMNNGLLFEIKGKWLTSILPDSIRLYKKVMPWKNEFYGDLMFSINDNDDIFIQGNMDGGSLQIKVLDSISFEILDWNGTRVTYSEEMDALLLGKRVFKRLSGQELENIIIDEDSLMNYVVKLIFTDAYLSNEEIKRIKYISLGLETYTPFTFDAIGINENGETKYYGWTFDNDTLRLFNTSYEYDDDSGFKYYKMEDLARQYYNNN